MENPNLFNVGYIDTKNNAIIVFDQATGQNKWQALKSHKPAEKVPKADD